MERRLTESLSTKQVLEEGPKLIATIKAEIRKVVYGEEYEDFIDLLVLAIIRGGHLYTRANVGTAKTLACLAVSRTLAGGGFSKVDFQPDLIPKDLAGFLFYNQKTEEFVTLKGPLLKDERDRDVNIFLANEINRGTPKLQSALLSAMEEKTITIHTTTYSLPAVFTVLATMNPQEHEGVFLLPEATLDRFTFRVELPPISKETEMEILTDREIWRSITERVKERVKPVADLKDIIHLREVFFSKIHIESWILSYIADLRRAIEEHENGKGTRDVASISPRASIELRNTAFLVAGSEGRDYVRPEDVKKYARQVLTHRVLMVPELARDPHRKYGPREIVKEVLEEVRPEEPENVR